MFVFLYNNMQFIVRTSPLLQKPSTLCSFRFISSIGDANQHSFTVSYLINSCGLSPESALSASKLVHFETPQKPDSVVSLLKKFGVSQNQISTIVKRYPPVLVCKPPVILPKLEFFQSKELSGSCIAHLLCVCPVLLRKSLHNHIIPVYDFLKNLLQSDENTIAAIRRCPLILSYSEARMSTKINFLRNIGVPESGVFLLLYLWPRTFIMNLDKFNMILERTREMGFNPSHSQFVVAFSALKGMSKLTWENKVDVFKKWNLSEEEILGVFRKHPILMSKSENKIMAIMDFIVNKLGWESSFIVKNPAIFGYSLEKRLVPRALVLQFLMLKGLVKKDYRSITIFACAESKFLQKFVTCHAEAPELLKIYSEKLALSR